MHPRGGRIIAKVGGPRAQTPPRFQAAMPDRRRHPAVGVAAVVHRAGAVGSAERAVAPGACRPGATNRAESDGGLTVESVVVV